MTMLILAGKGAALRSLPEESVMIVRKWKWTMMSKGGLVHLRERGIGTEIAIAIETETGSMTVIGIKTVNERGEGSLEGTVIGIENVNVIGIAPPGVTAILVLVPEWAVPAGGVEVEEGEGEELLATVHTMSIGRW